VLVGAEGVVESGGIINKVRNRDFCCCNVPSRAVFTFVWVIAKTSMIAPHEAVFLVVCDPSMNEL
jgi:hypothetical protein